MPQRDRVLHNVKRSKLSCAVGGGSGQADALLATALRHAAGRAHLRVEAQQRAQPQECVLLLDVVADATQRGAPRAGQRGAGARVGGMGRRAPEGGEARCLGGSCLAAAAARAQLVARARTGTVEGRAVTVWAGSVERPAPIWPCNRGAAGRGRGSPGAQEGGGVRRQRLGAHPGDAAKRDGRVLNQAAWQRARGDLPGVGWGGGGGRWVCGQAVAPLQAAREAPPAALRLSAGQPWVHTSAASWQASTGAPAVLWPAAPELAAQTA